jgi:Family of unknown function (DUF6893)
MRELIKGAILLAAAYVVVTSLPDVVRYIKIREM